MKIYTKTGDKGMTSLFGGSRVSKCSLQVRSYGEVDELVAYLGVLRAQLKGTEWHADLERIQQALMTACAYLASDEKGMARLPEPDAALVPYLEAEIDRMQTTLPAQKFFTVPGESLLSAQANLARTLCRRAERQVIERIESGELLPDSIMILLNRLSDYLYVLSRTLTQFEHSDEAHWIPKKKEV